MAVQARQLSLVLKASRFSPSPIIELQDIEDATKIIEKTAGTYKGLFEKVEVNAFFDKLSVLESRFMKKKKLNRRELLVNSRYTSEELNELLSHLVQTGRVRIFRNGTESSYASKDGKEEYRWVNGVRPLQEVQDEGSD
jgi:hypothetical protein